MGQGPSSIFAICPPTSSWIASSWFAGTCSEPSGSGSQCTPSRSKACRVARRSRGSASSITRSPPVTAARPMKLPISMWSARTRCRAPPSSRQPSMCSRFEPIPSMCDAHRLQALAQLLHVRLACGVHDRRSPLGERRGHERVLGAGHRRLVEEELGAAKPAGRPELVGPLDLDDRPEPREREQVRVDAAATDDVTARGRHLGTSEAPEQRACQQDRRADPLGKPLVERRRRDVGSAHAHLVRADPRRPRRRDRRAARASSRRRGCAARSRARPARRSAASRRAAAAPRSCSPRDEHARRSARHPR